MVVILFLSPQKIVLYHYTQGIIHVHGTCQYKEPVSFLSFSWKVELTLWKALKNMKNIDNIPVLT